MKFAVTSAVLALAATVAAVPSSVPRTPSEVAATLKRDPSGKGFTHIGSDHVVRTFDGSLNIIDSAPLLSARGVSNTALTPTAAIAEARDAQAKSLAKVAEEQQTRKRDPAQVLEALMGKRQESCVSEFCPTDEYCQGLSIYGYNCSSCLLVSGNEGNCQQF